MSRLSWPMPPTPLPTTCVNELAEVLVFGQKHASIAYCHVDHHGVISSRRQLSYLGHVMARAAQRPDNGRIAALVREKTHGRPSERHRLFIQGGKQVWQHDADFQVEGAVRPRRNIVARLAD